MPGEIIHKPCDRNRKQAEAGELQTLPGNTLPDGPGSVEPRAENIVKADAQAGEGEEQVFLLVTQPHEHDKIIKPYITTHRRHQQNG